MGKHLFRPVGFSADQMQVLEHLAHLSRDLTKKERKLVQSYLDKTKQQPIVAGVKHVVRAVRPFAPRRRTTPPPTQRKDSRHG